MKTNQKNMPYKPCSKCSGTGEVIVEAGLNPITEICKECNGEGIKFYKPTEQELRSIASFLKNNP